MKIKAVRVEQKEYDEEEVNNKINQTISSLEQEGYSVKGVRVAVGRDADLSSGLKKRFAITVLLIYD